MTTLCTNPDHQRKHSSLVSLHSIECAAIDGGLKDIQLNEGQANAWIRTLTRYFERQCTFEVQSIEVRFRSKKNWNWGEYFANSHITINTGSQGLYKGNTLSTLAHEFAHHLNYSEWRSNLDAYHDAEAAEQTNARSRPPKYMPHGAQFKKWLRRVNNETMMILTEAKRRAPEVGETVSQAVAAQMLGFKHVSSISDYIRAGKLEAVKVEGERARQVTLESIEQFKVERSLSKK